MHPSGSCSSSPLHQDSRMQCLCLQDCETLLEIILTIKCFTFSGFLCFHRKSLSMRKSGKFYLAIGSSDFVVTSTMHIAQAFVMPNIKWIWKSLQVPSAAHLQRSWNRNDIKNRGENSQICCIGGNIRNITIFKGSHRGAPLPVPTWTYAWTTPRSILRVLNNVAGHLLSNNIEMIEFCEV